MSLLEKYLKGWRFRSDRPDLPVNEEVAVFVTERNSDGTGVAQIGDTTLYVEGVESEHLEKRLLVHVTEYDPQEGVGRGEFREVVGESSYTTR